MNKTNEQKAEEIANDLFPGEYLEFSQYKAGARKGALTVLNESQWIYCDDRLPEEEPWRNVLIATTDAVNNIQVYISSSRLVKISMCYAWMELPDATPFKLKENKT